MDTDRLRRAILKVRTNLLILAVVIILGSAIFFHGSTAQSIPIAAGIFLAGDAGFQIRLWSLALREGWIARQQKWYMATLWAQLVIGLAILVLAVLTPIVTRGR